MAATGPRRCRKRVRLPVSHQWSESVWRRFWPLVSGFALAVCVAGWKQGAGKAGRAFGLIKRRKQRLTFQIGKNGLRDHRRKLKHAADKGNGMIAAACNENITEASQFRPRLFEKFTGEGVAGAGGIGHCLGKRAMRPRSPP